jgi:hypothetical protein
MKYVMTFSAAAFFTWLLMNTLIDRAYADGYMQGYGEGQQRALMAPESFETCTKWWFDGSESRARQAMNQYCDRRKK